MNFLKKLFNTVTICCFSMLLMSLSCSKSDDDDVVTPLNDFGVQYKADSTAINTYLKKHKLNADITDYSKYANNSNLFLETTNESESLWSLPSTGSTYPKLLYKEVKINSHMTKPYIVYYIVFNEGSTTEKPCLLDEVLVTYRGTSLKNDSGVVSATEFENSPVSSLWYLPNAISGWGEIFSMFGKGVFDEVATGNDPNVFTNYGAGIMFLPSGLAYYQRSPQANIPSYSPLVFSFQLFNIKRNDLDNDGILTIDEIVRNPDGSFTYTDTDGDGVADYKDFDDDNDGYPTLNEIKYTLPIDVDPLQINYYYPYNGALVDDPETLIDETKGIPNCSNTDFSTPTRVRKHLDKTCH